MGGSISTGTQTTGVNNADLNATISKLAKGISSEYTPGKSLYVPPGQTTQAGWADSLTAANNPTYKAGVGGALSDIADIAAGKRFGMNDPGYASVRDTLSNDVMTRIKQSYNNSGLYGSDNNLQAAGRGLGEALGGLDYGNYQNDVSRQERAIATLPQLFQAVQLPGSILQSVGASQDAAKTGEAAGPTDYLAKLSSIVSGTAGAAGTTSSKQIPLWQLLLGGGLGVLGAM